MRGLSDKTIIVAGGGNGIGAATARRLAEEGARVVVVDLNGDAAARVASAITGAGGQAHAVQADISKDADVRRLFDDAIAAFGGFDGLHFNAAALHLSNIDTDPLTIDMDVFDEAIRVNIRGAVLCTREALAHFTGQGKGGSIVYTGSDASYSGEPVRVTYAISKAGLGALVRNVVGKYGRQGIRANVVSPGPVITENLQATLTADQLAKLVRGVRHTRPGKPDDIAAQVAFLMSDDGEWISGQTISVNGGIMMRA